MSGNALPRSASYPVTIAVIDGPYDGAGLAGILAHPPISSSEGLCGSTAGAACEHGTFVVGLLGARADLDPPGLCPDCQIVHIPLFADGNPFGTTVSQLAAAITAGVDAGADLINLSLAVIGDDHDYHADLGSALDRAFAADAVVVAATGNQGREARGQLLSHPATIPVVALDRAGRPLLSSNLSPEIARGGVAAPGSDIPGYGPGGVPTRMTGTSAATAVAAGILAGVWASRPGITGAGIRAAVARLGPRGTLVPPALDGVQLMAALDQAAAVSTGAVSEMERRQTGAWPGNLSGKATMDMNRGIGMPAPARPSTARATPASLAGEGGCSCGAPGGQCACVTPQAESGFVYAIGTVEVGCPNPAVEQEMLWMAYALGVEIDPDPEIPIRQTEDRLWQYEVLSRDPKRTKYIARQLLWRLSVEDIPALVLTPREPGDYDDLINCLKRPKYPRTGDARSRTRGSRSRQSSCQPPPSLRPEDLDVVVGVRGAQTADGIEVTVDQLFEITPERYETLYNNALFGYLAQLADNFGLTDEDRAYNYLLARYDFSPDKFQQQVGEGYELAGAPTFVSRLSGGNRIVDVILKFHGTLNMMEKKYFLRVDVAHEFPMLVTTPKRYLDR
jgi:hypothetical protein